MQHAEHYFRIISAANAAQNQAQQGQHQSHGQGEQPQQHGHQGEHDGNGRAHGNNGQRSYMADDDDDDDVIAATPQSRSAHQAESSDEARTIEPAASGPTSFEPLPENPRPSQPTPQSLRELAEAAGRDAAPDVDDGGTENGEQRRAGRKKSTPKDSTDSAPAS